MAVDIKNQTSLDLLKAVKVVEKVLSCGFGEVRIVVKDSNITTIHENYTHKPSEIKLN